MDVKEKTDFIATVWLVLQRFSRDIAENKEEYEKNPPHYILNWTIGFMKEIEDADD